MRKNLWCRSLAVVGLGTLSWSSACKSDPTAPADDPAASPPSLLSVGSPGKDEDPSVLLLPSGRVLVAWFSDRAGSGDIYVAGTDDRQSFTAPVQVTDNPFGNFYPNLFLDSKGTIHLVWFEWVQLSVGQIRHSTSLDGTTWTPEEAVTTLFLVDDWVPTITESADGTLLVYFVESKREFPSTINRIYVAAKPPSASEWETAVPVPGVNTPQQHNHLPFASRIGGDVALVWVRHDTANAVPWSPPIPKSDLFFATSPDGRSFGNAQQVTRENGVVANLFPAIYTRHDGSQWILWLQAGAKPTKVLELPVAGLGQYPSAVVEASWLPDGYSHRVTRTAEPGQYLGAWVQGPEGSQEIYWRTVTR
ncbi:MAG: sialidase family protein [Gemmatimonadota bacterium]